MKIIEKYNSTSLVIRIITGLVIGSILGLVWKGSSFLPLLGKLFITSLKAVAPLLVFVLVLAALARGNEKLDERFSTVIFLYLFSTLLASVAAVIASFLFPLTLKLSTAATAEQLPGGVLEVLANLTLNMVANPINSIAQGNYIGILFWAVVFGFGDRKSVV